MRKKQTTPKVSWIKRLPIVSRFFKQDVNVLRKRKQLAADDGDECCLADSDSENRAAVSPYNVYGCDPDWCEMFSKEVTPYAPGKRLVAVIDLDLRALYLHIATWVEITKPNINWTISSYRQEDDEDIWFRGILLVPDESFEEVNAWFQAYFARIGNYDVKTAFPKIKAGEAITGTPVHIKGEFHNRRGDGRVPRQNLFEEWCWIIENCQGNIHIINDMWFFENNTEAVMFTLTNI